MLTATKVDKEILNRALSSKDKNTVATGFYKKIYTRFGIPEETQSKIRIGFRHILALNGVKPEDSIDIFRGVITEIAKNEFKLKDDEVDSTAERLAGEYEKNYDETLKQLPLFEAHKTKKK